MKGTNLHSEAALRDLFASSGIPALVALATPAPWDLLTHPPDPRQPLTKYLEAWAGMDEVAWPEANVKALYDDIMDIFRECPEAERWFREWRAAHPEARLS